MPHRRCKRRAIQNALGQLGWQTHSKDVVSLLAENGIKVTEGLVGKLKVENLKKVDEAKMRQARINQMARQRQTKSNIRLPQRRTYWR